MDVSSSKKRKTEENGSSPPQIPTLTQEDAQKIISTLSPDDLKSVVSSTILDSPSVLSAVRSIANRDPSQRKLFIRGLGWETNTESLRSIFSSFGDLAEAVVICDKSTGKSKGYGFITFTNIDGAVLALKQPSKQIDGRMTVTQLASAGNTSTTTNNNSSTGNMAVGHGTDVSMRKIYVGNVPAEMPAERLLGLFSRFGEIEEGPLGFDKQTGKFRGYTLFVYKTVEAARAAIAEPMKIVDGYHMICKLAIDGKKKPNEGKVGVEGNVGFAPQGGPGSYGIADSGAAGGVMQGHHHMNSPLQSSIASGMSGPPLSSMGSGGYGSGGGFVSGAGGLYGSSSQFSGTGVGGGYGGMGMGMGMGSSLYNKVGTGYVGSGGYLEGGPYGIGSMGHSSQHVGSPPGPRMPPSGGMYQGMPPYY